MSLGKCRFAVHRLLAVIAIASIIGAGHALRCVHARESVSSAEYSVEILPQIELLAAVQTQTSWIRRFEPRDGGNEYFRALKRFMEPFRDHSAVRILQKLLDKGFAYSYPVTFALCLGPLPELEKSAEYPQDIIDKVGLHDLEELRMALSDLARESDFLGFLSQWNSDSERWTGMVANQLNLDGVVEWLTRFFGWSLDEYRVVLAPAMFDYAYGPRISRPDGTVVAYQVICGSSDASYAPEFPVSRQLQLLTLHEFAHSFVNPTLEQYSDLLSFWEPLYRKVESRMKKLGYSTLEIFAHEQVVRAVTLVACRDLFGDNAFEVEANENAKEGFFLSEYIANQLTDYIGARDRYPTFADFMPELHERMKAGPLADVAKPTAMVWWYLSVVVILPSILAVRRVYKWYKRRC